MNHDAHTLREFDAALSSLNTYLLQMAYKAQSALDLAVASLLQQNESSANRVIADDEELDELEMTVDREGLHLLHPNSLFKPDLHSQHVFNVQRQENNALRHNKETGHTKQPCRHPERQPAPTSVNPSAGKPANRVGTGRKTQFQKGKDRRTDILGPKMKWNSSIED